MKVDWNTDDWGGRIHYAGSTLDAEPKHDDGMEDHR